MVVDPLQSQVFEDEEAVAISKMLSPILHSHLTFYAGLPVYENGRRDS